MRRRRSSDAVTEAATDAEDDDDIAASVHGAAIVTVNGPRGASKTKNQKEEVSLDVSKGGSRELQLQLRTATPMPSNG